MSWPGAESSKTAAWMVQLENPRVSAKKYWPSTVLLCPKGEMANTLEERTRNRKLFAEARAAWSGKPRFTRRRGKVGVKWPRPAKTLNCTPRTSWHATDHTPDRPQDKSQVCSSKKPRPLTASSTWNRPRPCQWKAGLHGIHGGRMEIEEVAAKRPSNLQETIDPAIGFGAWQRASWRCLD